MTKEKILLVCKQDISLSGGVESTMRLFSRELTEFGYEVGVLYFDRKIKYFNNFLKNDIQFFVAPVQPSKIPIILFRNYRKATQEAISVIFQSFVPDKIWSRYAIATWGIFSSVEFERLNIKLIHIFPTTAGFQNEANLHRISLLPHWKRPKHYLLGWLYFWENRKADTAVLKSNFTEAVVFSKNMLRQLSCEYNIPKEKINYIKPGIDLTKFNGSVSREEVETMRSALPHLPKHYAIYVGRLEENKNVDFLISCLNKIENINLVIVGEGPLLETLKDLVSQLNITGRVFFTGKQQLFLKALYTEADFLILPSRVESFGMVILESLACGTPVIAFGGKGISTAAHEIIQTEANGIVVSEITCHALVEAIKKMRDKREQVKRKSREENISYVQQNWSHKNMIQRLLDL